MVNWIESAKRIRRIVEAGKIRSLTIAQIAQTYNVTPSYVSQVLVRNGLRRQRQTHNKRPNMPILAGEELVKVTLHLYKKDRDELSRKYGYGWSNIVREWVRDRLQPKTPYMEPLNGQ